METHLEKIRNRIFALETNLNVVRNRVQKDFPKEKIIEVLDDIDISIEQIKVLASEKDSKKISSSLKKLADALEQPTQQYLPGDLVWARVQDCPYQLKVIGTHYFNTQVAQWVYSLEPASDEIWNQIKLDNNMGRFGFGKGIINLNDGQLYRTLDDLSHSLISGFAPGETRGPFDKCFQKRKERRN